MAKDCQKCRAYKGCIGKPWYSYSDIRFCPYQIIWIITNSETLGVDGWPTNPEGSSYIDPGIKTGYASEAYFVKPSGIKAEVEYRLQTTGDAGEALVDEIHEGIINIDSLSRPAYRALMYLKGKRRKKIDFKRWLREVYYVAKTGKKHQF